MSVKLFNNPKNGQVAAWLKQRPLKDRTYGIEMVGGFPTKPYKLNIKTLAGLLNPITGIAEVLKKGILSDAERIMIGVGQRFGISKDQLQGRCREMDIVAARQMGMWIIRNRYGNRISLRSIGNIYGGRGHATALHAINSASDLMETSRAYNKQINELMHILT